VLLFIPWIDKWIGRGQAEREEEEEGRGEGEYLHSPFNLQRTHKEHATPALPPESVPFRSESSSLPRQREDILRNRLHSDRNPNGRFGAEGIPPLLAAVLRVPREALVRVLHHEREPAHRADDGADLYRGDAKGGT
jgi:hypothetical protein